MFHHKSKDQAGILTNLISLFQMQSILTDDARQKASAFVVQMESTYLDNQKAQEHLDLMVIELEVDSLLRRKCEYKYAWVLREIREAVRVFGKQEQLRKPRSTTQHIEARGTYTEVTERLAICQQTLADLDKAAKGLSADAFDSRHPSNTWIREMQDKLDTLKSKPEKVRSKLKNSELKKRFNVNVRRHNDVMQMLYCRDPQESKQEIAAIIKEYDEIANLSDELD